MVAPEPYTIGNAPRTSNIRNPGTNVANMSLLKEFYQLSSIREGMHLEFRAEFFNAFNHPRFSAAPMLSLDSGSFGYVDSTCGAAREVQMALKFYW